MLFLIHLLLAVEVLEGVDEKTFQLTHVGKTLNITASHKLKQSSEVGCLTACLYRENCDGIGLEQQNQNMYVCHLYDTDPCSFEGNQDKEFVERPNFKFFQAKRYDCLSLRESGMTRTGVYEIFVDGTRIPVWCDMKGGWTVLTRRDGPEQLFNKTWNEYKKGFGSAKSSFWLGNDNLHKLTKRCPTEAKINLVTKSTNENWEAQYFEFGVGNEEEKYRLSIGDTYAGSTAPTAEIMENFNGQMFSTIDADNDEDPKACSSTYGSGGWWFKSCHYFGYLNGIYAGPFTSGNTWDKQEVVYSSLNVRRLQIINLTQGKPTDSSPIINAGSVSFNGNDGAISYSSPPFHSSNFIQPWWKVDLLQNAIVFSVKIYPRNRYGQQFQNIDITTIDEDGNEHVCFNVPGPLINTPLQKNCSTKRKARYIKARKLDLWLGYLVFHEIVGFGYFL